MKSLLTILLLIGLALPALADEVITGKVKAFGPGDLVTLYPEGDGAPRYFHLDKDATWEDRAGDALHNQVIYPESTVTLYYEVDDDSDKIVINKVIVLVPGKPVTTAATTTTTETTTTTTTTTPVPAPAAVPTDRNVIVESTLNGLKATEVVTTQQPVINADGQIVDFVPGKSITVSTTNTARNISEPMTYLIRKDVVYAKSDGTVVDATALRPGVPVTVYYDDAGDIRGVNKIVVRETVTTTKIRE